MASATPTTTTPSSPSEIDELLTHQTFQTLTRDQVTSFLRHGFLRVPGAIPSATCDRWTRHVWPRLGMDPEDRSTWRAERSHLAKLNVEPARDLAPRAWAAICELCGGEDRIAMPGGGMWTDGFIVNLGTPSSECEEEGKRTKKVPPRALTNWHVDGDFFAHFLDSPEQALLVIPCWSDVGEDAGATWICDEGPRRIGKMLALRPPFQHSIFNSIIQDAPDSSFHEMTGAKGDVILMHPLMLHSASVNHHQPPQCPSAPPSSSTALTRRRTAWSSSRRCGTSVSASTSRGGPAALRGWRATGPREMFMPARLAAQEQKRDEEVARLRALGIETGDHEFSQGPYLLISQQEQQQQQQQQQAVIAPGLTA
ncbi:uncharacterized protein PG986_004849 [Apiospora aurea]|uniref:Uncharacterized protein n=1 Tax=Apiospora aurea TaxID=335848 RepID=A0ABR1QFX0_9PEZI